MNIGRLQYNMLDVDYSGDNQ